MGEALITGLLRAGWTADRTVVVVEQDPGRKRELEGRFADLLLAGSLEEAARMVTGGMEGSGALVAVKPVDVEVVCRELGAIGVQRVLSIAAGIPTADIEHWLGGDLGRSGGEMPARAEGSTRFEGERGPGRARGHPGHAQHPRPGRGGRIGHSPGVGRRT